MHKNKHKSRKNCALICEIDIGKNPDFLAIAANLFADLFAEFVGLVYVTLASNWSIIDYVLSLLSAVTDENEILFIIS